MKRRLRAAVICGWAPLLVGIVIFLAWLITGASWLMFAGLMTIYAGMCAIGVGTILLATHVWLSWRQREIARRRLIIQTIAVLALFAVNFLAAGGAVAGALAIDSRYTVSVTNQSAVPLQSVRAEGGGVAVDLGDVPPGETVTQSFWIVHDGQLALSGRYGSKEVHAIIDGYVTNGVGGDVTVSLDTNGDVSVSERR